MSTHPVYELHNGERSYPKQLAALSGAPDTLYCRGDRTLLEASCIAVVGTRQATEYGIEATRRITGMLSRAGLVVVSGLALGIDAVAHRTTLDADGKTIAVLGCGVDDETIGPKQNVPLARDILMNGGLIVSEYPPGTPADKWTFPARNRIISGLSKGVLVTEAAIKSGALITARLAADQGRDVFAVPGGIFWPRSEGPNHLIANGAKTVVSADDILEEYGLTGETRVRAVSTHDPVQQSIAAILDDGPAHTDAIIASVALPASQVIATLSRMELTGLVVSTESGLYRIS